MPRSGQPRLGVAHPRITKLVSTVDRVNSRRSSYLRRRKNFEDVTVGPDGAMNTMLQQTKETPELQGGLHASRELV